MSWAKMSKGKLKESKRTYQRPKFICKPKSE